MWASGSFTFPPSSSPARPLSIGDTSIETTRIFKIEYKPKKDLLFVHQEKTYAREGEGGEGEQGVLAKERRVHVFRRAVKATAKLDTVPPSPAPSSPVTLQEPMPVSSPSSSSSSPSAIPESTSTSTFTYTYTPTPTHLFRFSALTFNAHKIHTDPIWTREIEGHPDGVVVHGPLTALVMLECVSRWVDEGWDRDRDSLGKTVRGFEYRAVSPMYAGKEINFYGRYIPVKADREVEAKAKQLGIWAEQAGKVGMRGLATIDSDTGK
jgi:hydroxyacyl-ACP dehydratase HTD2-like protein with hotdog domain